MEKGCQSVHWLHRGCVDIRHLHYYGRHTTENQSGRCRLNKGNFSTVLPHAALKCRAYFSAYLILVHCSICFKNAGGIDSWAIKTFRRRLWKRKVKALLYYLNGAEVFNQTACLVRSMERFYELSWLLFVFFLMLEYEGGYESNWSGISLSSPQQHVLFTVSHFHAVNWEFFIYFFFFLLHIYFLVLAHRIATEIMIPHINAHTLSHFMQVCLLHLGFF